MAETRENVDSEAEENNLKFSFAGVGIAEVWNKLFLTCLLFNLIVLHVCHDKLYKWRVYYRMFQSKLILILIAKLMFSLLKSQMKQAVNIYSTSQ